MFKSYKLNKKNTSLVHCLPLVNSKALRNLIQQTINQKQKDLLKNGRNFTKLTLKQF